MRTIEELGEQVKKALELILSAGSVDGAHHKQWVLDQVVRVLTDCPIVVRTAKDRQGNPYTYPVLGESPEYLSWVGRHNDGEDGPDTYEWDEGIAP